MRFVGSASVGSLLAVAALRPAIAYAAVRVACPPLAEQDSAQVEARLRAEILGYATAEPTIDIACDGQTATVLVALDEQSSSQRLDLGPPELRERLIDTAEELLASLTARETEPQVEESADEEPPRSASQARPAEPVPSSPHRREIGWHGPASVTGDAEPGFRLSVLVMLEAYGESAGAGGEFGVERQWGRFGVGVSGGLVRTEPNPEIRTHEWFGSAGVVWRSTGFATTAFVGMSTLVAGPTDPSLGPGRTSAPVLVGGLRLGYALRFGDFTVTPAVGARAFTHRRRVQVDEARFELGGAVPHFSLALGYVFANGA